MYKKDPGYILVTRVVKKLEQCLTDPDKYTPGGTSVFTYKNGNYTFFTFFEWSTGSAYRNTLYSKSR